MSLTLVQTDNVIELYKTNCADIAGMAREFADALDEEQYGPCARALVILEREDGLTIFGWGEGVSAYEMMGLFEAGKLRVFADSLVEDD